MATIQEQLFEVLKARLSFFGKAVFGQDFDFEVTVAPGSTLGDPTLMVCRVVSVNMTDGEVPSFYWGFVSQGFSRRDEQPEDGFAEFGSAKSAGPELDAMLKDVLKAVFDCKISLLDLALQDAADKAAGHHAIGYLTTGVISGVTFTDGDDEAHKDILWNLGYAPFPDAKAGDNVLVSLSDGQEYHGVVVKVGEDGTRTVLGISAPDNVERPQRPSDLWKPTPVSSQEES